MPLPLIPLAMGLMSLGSLGELGSNKLKERKRNTEIENFAERARVRQAGLDLSTPEGRQILSERQLLNPDSAQFGNQFLQQQQRLGQDQSQFDTTFNEISAFQQASLDQRGQIAANTLAKTQPFAPVNKDLISYEGGLADDFRKDTKQFSDMRNQITPLMASLARGDTGVDAFAQMFKFIKTLDPGMVTGDDADNFNASKSIFSQMGDKFRKGLKGGGYDFNDRMIMAQSLKTMFDASLKSAQGVQQQYQFLASGVDQNGQPIPGVPQVDPMRVTGAVDLSPMNLPEGFKKGAKKKKVAYTDQPVDLDKDGFETIIVNGQEIRVRDPDWKKKNAKSPGRFF